MKANEKYLIRFLESSDTNFVIPVYQRNYDWKKEQCKQLYDDLVSMIKNGANSHFFGTIVSIYNDSGRNREYLIIDGQQRTTTISILLLAIYNILEDEVMKSDKIIRAKILNQYLINQYSDDESKVKLKPIKGDSVAFDKLFKNDEFVEESNVTQNYKYFYKRIQDEEVKLDKLYEAIEKLMIVEIELKNGEDDPQLIFESLNSTGLDLTDADKVRNFILMGETAKKQELLYSRYWNKVERNTGYKVTQFLRDYLTMKENKIANVNKIYSTFKNYILSNEFKIEEVLRDILKFSENYSKILNSNLGISEVDEIIKRINKLEVKVSYPFFLGVLDDYNSGYIDKENLIEVFRIIESYIFRRIACKIPTNALNKVFMNLQKEIKNVKGTENSYGEVLKYILTNKKASQRYPKNEEFKRAFIENDFYNMNSKNKSYLLERLENYNNNEKVDLENLISSNTITIEHIMPQHLSPVWKKELGEGYQEIHEKYLDTIGNLTLTGYNSKMSNKSFIEKRDMEKGFKDSRLRMNKYLVSLDSWNEENILKRANSLFDLSLDIWKYYESSYRNIKEDNVFSLSDEDDFTNTKVKKYKFMEEEVKVKTWTELYQSVCKALYELDSIPSIRLATKSFENKYLEKRFSVNGEGLRDAFRVGNEIFIEKNLNTEAKVEMLRVIFDEYELDYNELLFYLD